MIERPGTPPPTQEPPKHSKKTAQPGFIRVFGYQIKLGYVGRKLVIG